MNCAVCHEPVETPIFNVDGKLVCQPYTLYFRAEAERRAGTRTRTAAYLQALIDHGLAIKRDTPRPPGEPLLPCGFGMTLPDTKGTPEPWRPDPAIYPGPCTCDHSDGLPMGSHHECDPECKPCHQHYADWLSVQ